MKHYVNQNDEYIGAFGGGAVVPDGALEVTPRPTAQHKWIDGDWIVDPAEALAAWRSTATVSRAEFVIACVGAGILTEADGEKAATGEWPDAFNGFLTGMDFAGRVRARAEWKDNATIRRLAPTLLALQAVAKLTDDQVDALFGRVA
jgi:hypothetical protein